MRTDLKHIEEALLTPTPKHIEEAQRLAEELVSRMFTPAVRGFAGDFACEHAVIVLQQRFATLLAAQEELERQRAKLTFCFCPRCGVQMDPKNINPVLCLRHKDWAIVGCVACGQEQLRAERDELERKLRLVGFYGDSGKEVREALTRETALLAVARAADDVVIDCKECPWKVRWQVLQEALSALEPLGIKASP